MKAALYLGLVLIAVAGVILVTGLFVPDEHVAKRTIIINAPLDKVWSTVTDIENQLAWRDDLEDVKIIERSEEHLVWVEYPRKGRPITFREKVKRPYSRYEIEIMPGGSFSGYWVGEFREVDGGTRLVSTEYGKIHNPVFRVLAYLFFDLEQTIRKYQEDLKNHMETDVRQ